MFFSVVVPTYNSAESIIRCVDALTKIDYPNYEIIVVDDGSTDNSQDILADYPIVLVRQENQGPAAARNNGIKIAKGEVVVMAVGARTFVAVAVESMGVSVGKTRITGVLVGTASGVSSGSTLDSEVGCSVGVAVSLAVWSRLASGRGRSQELVETTTTNATKSKQGIVQTRLSIMGMPPLPVAV